MLLNKNALAVARGLGIIFVVRGHMTTQDPFFVHPYGFHMPLFFFLSGMSLLASLPVASLLKRDSQSLLFYTLVHVGIFATLTVLVFQPMGLNLRTSSPLDWQTYFTKPFTANSHHVILFLVAWFLIALFFVRLLCVLILKGLAQLPERFGLVLQIIIATCMGFLGMQIFASELASSKFWLWNVLSQVFVGAFFCLLGHVAQNKLRLPGLLPCLLAAVLLYAVYYVISHLLTTVPMSMAFSLYKSGFLVHTFLAFLGIAMVLFAAEGLQSLSWLKTLGIYSKPIMSWHMTVFASINLVFAVLGLVSPSAVNAFTMVKPTRPHFIILYLALGIAAPVLAARILEKARKGQWLAAIQRQALFHIGRTDENKSVSPEQP
ncbi:hypothetical protein MHY87_18180 [Microvirga sp. ACRRW]|uniref:acyltransferase family protein n=1 Tax=Microvirga sp. ACRRW TaxID=2918205 RepID=UPI001EF45A17|nr:acyltransferase family protein [Microvirga sp. ACRRW]MCG7394831.1 hypothetical protein [Microvirga sp. ACRRW]